MCIDDYEFRHYSAIRSKQCRRFVFIDQDDIEKAYLVNISQFQEEEEVALCKIILHLSNKGLSIAGRSFYWPKHNIYVQPGDYCKVPFWTLSDKEIILHSTIKVKEEHMSFYCQSFNVLCSKEDEMAQNKEETDSGSMRSVRWGDCQSDQMEDERHLSMNSSLTSTNLNHQDDSIEHVKYEGRPTKRTKEPERLIGQVIIALKKWRKLYDSKKLNLTKAAKILGFSKKSLDDYFLIFRVGEILGFDFGFHFNHKMGELRTFIKKSDYKVRGKLPKKVKCFGLVPDFDVNEILQKNQQALTENPSSIDRQ